MPRLPPPNITVRTHRGRLLEPMPASPLIAGIHPTRYRPVAPRTLRPATQSAAVMPVPAGYVDAAVAARALDRPEALLIYRAQHHPELLPPHVLVDGRPHFRRTDLPGVPA